ncbi:MAG: hypothetical protein ACK4HV_04330 [Parachlamydiaceae bacterium]
MKNRLDEIMPSYDFNEIHEKLILNIKPIDAFNALKALDFGESLFLRALFALRGLKAFRFDEIIHLFTPLYLKEGEEWDLGLIAKPWTLTGHIVQLSPDAFSSFNSCGYAKMVWHFSFLKEGDNTLVKTETRILCLDRDSLRKFKRYWFFVKPFSGLVRKKILSMLEKKVAFQS